MNTDGQYYRLYLARKAGAPLDPVPECDAPTFAQVKAKAETWLHQQRITGCSFDQPTGDWREETRQVIGIYRRRSASKQTIPGTVRCSGASPN